ncbi:hypothetical protein [Empedobacter brevis]|uniref:hypothetical protein n=1 Tax=Empedobacter brevis TaxID=247 RepID=UPI00333EF6BF
MKKILLSILLISSFLTLSSCGDKKGGRNDLTEKEENIGNKLIIKVQGVFQKNDHFQLFYSNDSNFLEENSIRIPVYGQTIVQDVIFELPEGKKPQNLRLDLGENKEQTTVTIKDISLEFNGEKIENLPEKFRELFSDTYFTVYNPITLEYELRLNDQNTFDPMLISTDKLKKSLNKLYNESKQNQSK